MAFITPGLDQNLFLLINRTWRFEILDAIMPLISSSAFLWIVGLILFLPALRVRPGRQIVCILALVLAVGAADAGTNVLKDTFKRIRPLNAQEEVHYHEDGKWQVRPKGFIKKDPGMTSYPSAHASNSMAAAVMAALLWPASRRFIWILPFLIGYSRIYLAKHYPTDVLGGWLFGAFVAGSLYLFFVWLDKRRRFTRPIR